MNGIQSSKFGLGQKHFRDVDWAFSRDNSEQSSARKELLGYIALKLQLVTMIHEFLRYLCAVAWATQKRKK